MADNEPVGYKRPPVEHRFTIGNKAASKANRKAKKKAKRISISDAFDQALRKKRRLKRGDEIISVDVAEIFVERLVQMLTSDKPRDVALAMQLMEKHLPDALSRTAETLEIIHYRAEGSAIAPPPDDLWQEPKK